MAADALLALRGIKEPSEQQKLGALIEAKFQLTVTEALESMFKG